MKAHQFFSLSHHRLAKRKRGELATKASATACRYSISIPKSTVHSAGKESLGMCAKTVARRATVTQRAKRPVGSKEDTRKSASFD